ncbi:redoxin domain-containing protein [Cecembia lonarensis]|uniref:Thiol-disulfide oxidoreductase resA n=1 Tax=Cecembia lonarensis (strain CCUG 58316 / KCTC 22772 / LW9) TaxID=1225176 RepID=K1KVM6_CECL9|nr:redoxin domain-containing protein [Cecembia lonarensis]EKB48195.1 Thiol-disulfide oxidoreductase resA [Cecembia lonarensis LW9]
MKQLTVILLLLFSFKAFSQEDSKLDKKSPELTFENILNFEKNNAKLSDFKDKIVILDFWATWCAPCIKSFPQLEELQNKFGEELQIITITDDPEERINRFLEKREMNLPIVIDEKRELAKVFPHRAIPHTVVIDKSGVIKAITTSSEITEELIYKVLNNQEVNLKEKKDAIDFDPSIPLSGNENFTYQITITPFKDGYPSFVNTMGGEGPYNGRRIIATNLSARPLYEIAYQFPTGIRTIVEVSDKSKFEWNRQNAICFDLIVPEDLSENRFKIMKQHLDIYFGYQSIIEERIRPVKILKQIEGKKIEINVSKEGTDPFASYGGRGLSMKGSPIETLASFLESQIHKPVLNETDLSGLYDLEIPWYNENPEQIHDELRKIGLEMIDAERKIEVLVIKDK